MNAIQILNCSVKPCQGADMEERLSLECLGGVGIRGDANALAASPRQVLLVDEDVYRRLELPRSALRENLLVRGLCDARLRSGDILRSPSGVVLRVTLDCEPCHKLNAVRPGLAREVLGERGVLARVVTSGPLVPGEAFQVVRRGLDALAPTFGGRVHHILRAVPEGRVTTLREITIMAGVPKSFARVLPRILRAAPVDVPVHRSVTSSGELMTAHIARQRQLLEEEGLQIEDGRVPASAIWTDDPFRAEEAAASRS